jgi:CheY-like chemotaxis protein
MSRRVLLVDPDVDALGKLASALRARGVEVANASDPFDAVEVAFQSRPDVVLVAPELDSEGELTAAFRAVSELASVPLLHLLNAGDSAALKSHEVLRADLDYVVSRITAASPRANLVLAQDIRGTLEQVPLADLLQLLAMNRRSGVLGITTATATGEVRLAEGEVIDALYRRLEGDKALFRMLGEAEGRFAFTPCTPPGTRRIQASTAMLLMEGMRQVDEVARLRRELTPSGEGLWLDEDPRSSRDPEGVRASAAPGLAEELWAMLQIPRSLDELLDELGAPDPAILAELARLTNGKRLRRVPLADLTTPLAPEEQLPVLRSLVTRLARPGFSAPPRLVIAARAKRIPVLAHAVRRIADAAPPPDGAPRLAVARPLGTLRFGDGVELALTGLPMELALAPMWGLSLAGALAVVRLEDAGGATLAAHCEAAEVILIEAESLMGALDLAVPGQIAALVRSALEVAAGV